MARPTDYTPELAERICQHIAGGESLRSFCRLPGEPHVATVCRWIVKHDEFREQYTHAREAAGYAHGDGVIEVVEAVRNGDIDAQTARAMMDGLKWAAERMAPKSHSSRQEIDHTTRGESLNAATPAQAAIERFKKSNDPEQ